MFEDEPFPHRDLPSPTLRDMADQAAPLATDVADQVTAFLNNNHLPAAHLEPYWLQAELRRAGITVTAHQVAYVLLSWQPTTQP